MVKLFTSLLPLALITSLALAAPHPSRYYDRDLLERELEDFVGREYLLDTFDELAARDPSFFSKIGDAIGSVGKVASKGLNIAEKIVKNPIVQAGLSVIPGGGKIAQQVGDTIGMVRGASQKIDKIQHLGSSLLKKGGLKQLGATALGQANPIGRARQFLSFGHRRHHRRDLEDDEELSRRDLDAEELWEREFDDEFLAERDFFDDLD
jgi:hypothetical protein